jgi:HPt (histidine-containing phosphotransfer) domain-containing protein
MAAVLTKPIRRHMLLTVVDRWLAQCASQEQKPAPILESPVASGQAVPLDLPVAIYEFGESELVRQVVQELIGNVAEKIDQIRQAWLQRDLPSIGRHAHAIKGGAVTIEAQPLATSAAALEAHCKSAHTELVAPGIASLETCFIDFKQFVASIQWP